MPIGFGVMKNLHMVSEPKPRFDSPKLHPMGVLEESPHLYGICNFDPGCHAPTPAVVFQLLIVSCGTTEHFIFTNTYVHGLRLKILYLVYFSSPNIIIIPLY